MKFQFSLLAPLAVCCTLAFAQDTGTNAQAATDTQSTTYQTPQGTLEVNSGQPGPRAYGPPPPFAQLASSHDGFITRDEAAAYALLANDFIHADLNRDGRISKAEYAHWLRTN